MRVIHVAPTPFGADGLLGGGERYPVELARALSRHVDCELVTFGRVARTWREPTGLRVRMLRRLALLRGHPAHPVAPQLAPLLARSLRDADLVHTHHLRSAPARIAALVAAAVRRPLVTTDHGLGGGGWSGLLSALVDRFLTVSEFSARTLHAPPERTRVIYGGADPHVFRPDDELSRAGLLFVGRITPHKGLDRLLRALPAAARLTVVGTGGHDPRPPERNYPELLRRLAVGRDVRFAGAVGDADLPAVHRRAAVFVLPSVNVTCYGRHVAISELLGLSLLEAMASGTPVVASRIGGLPEVVRDGDTGFLVSPGDDDELRDRVAQLLGDPRLARRMGRAAREAVLERFTWAKTAERCLAAYTELPAR